MSLSVLVMIEMWNSLNALSENMSIFKVGIFSNLYLWVAIAISSITHCLILYVPYLNQIFKTTKLSLSDWLYVLLFSLPVILIEEIIKYFVRLFDKKIRAQQKKYK